MSKDFVSDYVYIDQNEAEFTRAIANGLKKARGMTEDPDLISLLQEIFNGLQLHLTYVNLRAASGISQVTMVTPACPTIETPADFITLEAPEEES